MLAAWRLTVSLNRPPIRLQSPIVSSFSRASCSLSASRISLNRRVQAMMRERLTAESSKKCTGKTSSVGIRGRATRFGLPPNRPFNWPANAIVMSYTTRTTRRQQQISGKRSQSKEMQKKPAWVPQPSYPSPIPCWSWNPSRAGQRGRAPLSGRRIAVIFLACSFEIHSRRSGGFILASLDP